VIINLLKSTPSWSSGGTKGPGRLVPMSLNLHTLSPLPGLQSRLQTVSLQPSPTILFPAAPPGPTCSLGRWARLSWVLPRITPLRVPPVSADSCCWAWPLVLACGRGLRHKVGG
jgi:hypothetical protein